MPKKLIKKYLPDPEKLKQQKSLQFLGDRLHEPNLWHLNRRSVSLAFAIGLFVAWIPTPTQMAIAAISALKETQLLSLNFDDAHKYPKVISRNRILHGNDLNFGSLKNSLKTISMLNFITETIYNLTFKKRLFDI